MFGYCNLFVSCNLYLGYSVLRTALTHCKLNGFRFYFTPLSGVLFAFPSRYLFTIGEKRYLVLDHDRPRFTPGFTCPVLLGNTNLLLLGFQVRDFHPLWSSFPGAFLYRFAIIVWVPQPHRCVASEAPRYKIQIPNNVQ